MSDDVSDLFDDDLDCESCPYLCEFCPSGCPFGVYFCDCEV